jgi:hypothetical protein
MQSDFAPELEHGIVTSKIDLALIANPSANRNLTTTKITEAPFHIAIREDHVLRSGKAFEDVAVGRMSNETRYLLAAVVIGAVCMCRLARIAAMIPSTRLRRSSTRRSLACSLFYSPLKLPAISCA